MAWVFSAFVGFFWYGEAFLVWVVSLVVLLLRELWLILGAGSLVWVIKLHCEGRVGFKGSLIVLFPVSNALDIPWEKSQMDVRSQEAMD
jgi:hypothetical protein